MNKLDTAVKSSFAEMVAGRVVVLDATAARIWAAWAVKQFLSYQAAYPDDLSGHYDYQLFRSTEEPLDGQQVYLGIGTDLPWVHLHARRPAWTNAVGGEQICALQLWTVVYGQLVVQVVASHSPTPGIPMRTAATKLSALWPVADGGVRPGTNGLLGEKEVVELTKLKPLLT